MVCAVRLKVCTLKLPERIGNEPHKLIKELQELSSYTDEVLVSTGGFILSDIEGLEINHFEGEPLSVIIRVKMED